MMTTPSSQAAPTVQLPAVSAPREHQQRRRTGGWRLNDVFVMLASAGSAAAFAWTIGGGLHLVESMPQVVLIWYVAFLAFSWVAVRAEDGPVLAGDRFMGILVSSAALLAAVPLLSIVWLVLRRGIPSVRPHFFYETMQFVGPTSSAFAGGAAQAIVGTLEQVGIACLISVPLGFICAVFLTEIGGPIARLVRIFVDAMSGVPTIVAGLFVYASWVVHFGFSGFAAALAISISMLPVIARTAEEVLRLVPSGLREASLALGATEYRTTVSVVLPTARAGLVTAVILGIARAIGETAPLIMTAFGASLMNANPFHGAQAALPLFIYRQITESSQANVQARAWAGAFVLLVVVLTLFIAARVLAARAGRPRAGRSARRGRRAKGAA